LTKLASSDVDACVEAVRLLVADLYDPKGGANLLIDKHRLEDNSNIGFLLSAKNLFTITDIVFGKLHHRLLVLKITSQESKSRTEIY
jgi:hypothetical protein